MIGSDSTHFILIGQGLAGTLLHFFLSKGGQEAFVLDEPRPDAASRVAAGLMNPITGRKFVKSWRVDELLPAAWETYRELEAQLGLSVFYRANILRAWARQQDENQWLERSGWPGYEPYMLDEAELGQYARKLHPAHGYGEVTRSGRADLGRLVDAYREYLRSRELYREEAVDYSRFEKQADGRWRYGELTAGRVVFCEGYRAVFNPFFNHLPFRGAKGEVLIVHMPGAGFEKIVKQAGLFIVPLGEDRYWIGSAYQNQFEHTRPTPEGRARLEARLQQLVDLPYELLEHRAAVRPTVKDRRPFLGEHPQQKGLFLFNGLGTKGASLGPFFARQLAEHLLHGAPLDPEVDIRRFDS